MLESFEEQPQQESLSEKLSKLTTPVSELEEGLLVSATYDGDKRVAVLKFYDPKRDRVWLWEDKSGHKPYCVEGDTMLLGDNKTIAEVHEGDQVLGLTGEVVVNGKMVRDYKGKMMRIRASGLLPVGVTPEHPVLVARSKRSGHRALSDFVPPSWKRPTELQPKLSRNDGDYLVMPIAKPRYDTQELSLASFSKMRSGWLKVTAFPVNERTAWLLGLYVAEGSSGGRRGAMFSLNKDEVVIQDKLTSVAREIGYSIYDVDNGGSSVRLHLGGAVIARAMDQWCGHRAPDKRIPDFILFHSNLKILESFLEGYTSGDGSRDFTRNTKTKHEVQTMVSVSKLLVLQLQQAYARLGIFAGINVLHKASSYSIQGRKVNQREAYTVSFVKQPQYTHAKRVGGVFYVPIRKIETLDFEGSVHNIETSDNTYLVSNAVVHNCYTKLPRAEVLAKLAGRSDILEIREVEKNDLLSDSRIAVRKIIATDPLAIGGQQGRSIRDIMDVWEGDIKYYENYVYDKSLRVGTYYKVTKGAALAGGEGDARGRSQVTERDTLQELRRTG